MPPGTPFPPSGIYLMNRIYLYSSVQLLSRVPATTIIFSLSALTWALTAKLEAACMVLTLLAVNSAPLRKIGGGRVSRAFSSVFTCAHHSSLPRGPIWRFLVDSWLCPTSLPLSLPYCLISLMCSEKSPGHFFSIWSTYTSCMILE